MDEIDYSLYVPNVHFEQIPIRNLVSNQEYQRNLAQSHIRRTAEEFDLYQVNPVKVSRRNGINYVFNGQHTIEIIALVSGSRDTPVWCMIYDDMDYSLEADVFANQQKCVKALVPYEIFNANIEAGNDKQLTIKSLVESYHLTISGTKTPGTICAVSSLEYIYDKYGFRVLDRTLRLCIATWEGDSISLSANMLKGIAKLVDTFGDKMRDDVFKDKLGQFSPKEIARTAKDRRAGSLGFAEAILLAYNKKMKFSLKWGDIYSNKRSQEYDDNYDMSDESDEADTVEIDT